MTKQEEEIEMRAEYDFSNAVRNPYVQKFQELNFGVAGSGRQGGISGFAGGERGVAAADQGS